MNDQHRLNVDYWRNKKIWEIDQIPYLFLGYEPVPYNSRPLDDVTTLNKQESERYYQYWRLINEAIDLNELIPVKSFTARTTPLRAADIKKWRKTVPFIKPVKIYLVMEEEIPNELLSILDDANDPSKPKSTIKVRPKKTEEEPIDNLLTKPEPYSPNKRKRAFSPRDSLGRLMLNITVQFAKKNDGAIITTGELLKLLEKSGATINNKSKKELIKFTDVTKKELIILSNSSFENRFTRIRSYVQQLNTPTGNYILDKGS